MVKVGIHSTLVVLVIKKHKGIAKNCCLLKVDLRKIFFLKLAT